MKLNKLLTITLAFVAMSCAKDAYDMLPDESKETRTVDIALSGAETDGVSVYVFQENGSDYLYDKTVAGPWSSDNRTTTSLRLGKYKFLFTKFAGVNSHRGPVSLVREITPFDGIEIVTRFDSDRSDETLLPSDEIWLPKSEKANEIYHIKGNDDIIKSQLHRVVSQAVVYVKRGYKLSDETEYEPVPFDGGEDITDHFSSIYLTITNTANKVSLTGTQGSYNTHSLLNEAVVEEETGFAMYEGPFIIPNPSKALSTIHVTANPTDDSEYQQRTGTVTGLFEANKKLEITLWLIDKEDKDITITVKTTPIDDEDTGDSGIWN